MDIIAAIQAGFKSILRFLSGNKIGAGRVLRFQVINITVPANTAANALTEANVTLDREYNKIVGIGFFETSPANIADNYNVGARSNRKTWVDDININAWNANDNVGPMEKYIETDIDYGSGDTFYARVIPNSVPNAVVTGQMVLVLERTLTELPK